MNREVFESWSFELPYDVERKYSEPIVALMHEVEGLLAEASSAGWSEDSLRRELHDAISPARAGLVAEGLDGDGVEHQGG